MKRVLMTIGLILLAGCGSGEPPDPVVTLPGTAQPYLNQIGPNVMSVHVGATDVCGHAGYQNEPCTTITLCVPGTSECQTIPDMLVDTGSVGIRVFSNILQLSLPLRMRGSASMAECAQFGTGSDWGPLATADVVLAQEPAVTTSVQIVNRSFAPPPSGCIDADLNPGQAGFNGILGVGPLAEDCGRGCARTTENGIYFLCQSGSCAPVAVAEAQQLHNPVALLPVDNNGLLLALPQVGLHGSPNLEGVMILGIGTQENNLAPGFQAYGVDPNGNFMTQFQGQSYSGSFIDSGSNGLFFPNDVGIQECATDGGAPSFYCPDSIQVLSAFNLAYPSGGQAEVDFQLANAEGLLGTGNSAFEDLGGRGGRGTFDWGLPFFYGRAVFEGFSGRTSPLAVGPYWAY